MGEISLKGLCGFVKDVSSGKDYFSLKPLVDWLQGHSEDILKRIYSDNYGWLENYVLQNSGTNTDAQDVFQEGIAAAWINLQSGKFTGSKDQFNAYLRQICKYKWINELRASSRKHVSYTENVPEQHHEDGDLDAYLQQSSMLNRCFSQLGEKCRQVLGLFYYKRKTLAEIATDMQNTEDSIKTIKYRCMMQLRKLFQDEMKTNGGI